MDFCSIASGSSGNCIYVGSDQTSVLIDTGISRKRIVDGLHEIDRKPEELKGILITHEHSDHIKGLGVMSRKYHIPIYATAGTIDGIRNSTSLGQIDEDLFHTIRADGKFQIDPYYLKQRILGNRGHLSNENAGRLLCEILNDRIKTILLGHLSRENNYEALAYETVCAEVTLGDNPYKAGDFPIAVAARDHISPLYAL